MARELLVAVFPTRALLVQALSHIKILEGIDIQRSAIISINQDGEMVVVDDDISAAEGGPAGMILGALLAAAGMIFFGATRLPGIGPVLVTATGSLLGAIVGRVTGRFAASLLNFSFPRALTEDIAKQLQPGQPALLIETTRDEDALSRLEKALNQLEAQTVQRLENDSH